MRLNTWLLTGLAVTVVTLLLLAGKATTAEETFFASYDGDSPAAPRALYGDTTQFAIDLHDRNNAPEMTGDIGEHDPACGPPPATHTLVQAEDHVYVCSQHLMTAMGNPGYGAIYLTASATIDFSAGATISWEQDMSRGSTRNWTDLWITPPEDYLPLPVSPRVKSVDLQGQPCNAIQIEQDHHNSGTTFDGRVVRDCDESGFTDKWWLGLEKQAGWPGQDPTRRDLIVVMITPEGGAHYRVRVSMPEYANITWVDEVVEIPFSEGIVQWGQHAYTPDKACKEHLGGVCNPDGGSRDTVHWDNFRFNHATPFSITSAGSHTADTITLDGPGYLRFTSHSENPTVNGQPVSPQPSTLHDSGKAKNFLVEVPAGTYAVSGSRLKDLYAFQFNGGAPSTPSPTFHSPTFTAEPTPTGAPTATDSPGPPAVTPTATPTPTASPSATPTGTSTPSPSPTLLLITPTPTVSPSGSPTAPTVSAPPSPALPVAPALTPVATPTPTASPSASRSPSPQPIPTVPATPTPTASATPIHCWNAIFIGDEVVKGEEIPCP
jgi:hypothetical protein